MSGFFQIGLAPGWNSQMHSQQSSRRHFLAAQALGLGSVALTWLLRQDGVLAETVRPELEKKSYDLLSKPSFSKPQARAMVSLFMQGGPSHIDLTDPKPILNQLDGEKFPGDIKYDNAAEASSRVLGCPWRFRKHGDCGMEFSELLPHFGEIADDITLIRSMTTGVNNHGESLYALNTGRTQAGRPSLGSWLTYGLGTECQDLPAYVVLTDPGGLPVLGTHNWSNGWLPALYQGTVARSREPRILNLDPPPQLKGLPQERYLEYLGKLNREHLARHPGETDLEARIASYELAARMQTAAKEALDLSQETEATQKLYGLDNDKTRDFGTRCLLARRLIERGVRFVSVYSYAQMWDHHGALRGALPQACLRIDQPCAALVKDLKQRGLLDSTIVHWGGEMGRLPVIQNDTGPDRVGRDHNTYGFSSWFAGGGFKAGHTHGATDEFGHRAVEGVVTHHDYHATLLHLFGLDPKQLTFTRNAAPQSLIDATATARIVREVLA
jgi:hypothetical protein